MQPLPGQPNVPDQLADLGARADEAGFRIGIVSAVTANGIVQVRIGGLNTTLQDAVYLFGQYRPAAGDQVLLSRAGAAWVIHGALSSVPADNTVVNGSFEVDDPGTFPSGWGVVNETSSPAFLTDLPVPNLDSAQAAKVAGAALTSGWRQIAYSSPITVVGGDAWAASAWYTSYCTATDGNSVGLYLFWEPDADTLPTMAQLDSGDSRQVVQVDARFAPVGRTSEWTQLRQWQGDLPYTVPVQTPPTTVLRVCLVTLFLTGRADVWFDRVVAVKTADAAGVPA